MNLTALKAALKGNLFTDNTTRRLYSTDASAYKEMPMAVAIHSSPVPDQILHIKCGSERFNYWLWLSLPDPENFSIDHE